MTPDERKRLEKIEEILSKLLASDRYIIQRDLQLLDGRNIIIASGTGTQMGSNASSKLGFYDATPVTQRTSLGTSLTFTNVSGTGDDATINANFSNYKDRINAIFQIFEDLGLAA